jgi:hypothetical protein
MPPAPPAFRSGSSFIRGGQVSQSVARKQVALARSVDLGSLELGLVWTFLAFSLSLSFVAALADVTMGTVTSAAAYMANVKNRIADFLMCLSLRHWSRLMFKVRFNRTNVAVEIEPVCRFWSGPPPRTAKEARRPWSKALYSPSNSRFPICLLRNRHRKCTSTDHVKATGTR